MTPVLIASVVLLVASLAFFAAGVWMFQEAMRIRRDGDRSSKQLVTENLAASAREREVLIERMAELADKPLAAPAGSRRRQPTPDEVLAEQAEKLWQELVPAREGLMDDVTQPEPVDWGVR